MERELQEKGPGQLLLSSPLSDGTTTAQLGPLGMATVPGVTVSTATLVPGVQPLGCIDLAPQSIATAGIVVNLVCCFLTKILIMSIVKLNQLEYLVKYFSGLNLAKAS